MDECQFWLNNLFHRLSYEQQFHIEININLLDYRYPHSKDATYNKQQSASKLSETLSYLCSRLNNLLLLLFNKSIDYSSKKKNYAHYKYRTEEN